MYADEKRVTIITTRMIMSKFVPGGMKIFNNVEATKSNVIKGTPRMNSINQTQRTLTISRSDWRPKANNIPKGKEPKIAVKPIVNESKSPPKSRLGRT